jgi:hypothetical protein
VYGEASAAYDVDDMLRNVEQLIKVTPKSN